MAIRSATIRIGILISAVFIALIITMQVTWLKRVYELEQKEFNSKILKVIKAFYEGIRDTGYYQSNHLSELVTNPEPHLYTARVVLPFDTTGINTKIKTELIDFDIFTLCETAVYDHNKHQLILLDTIPSANARYTSSSKTLPVYRLPYDYVVFFFPNRNRYILSRMSFWLVSSGLLLFILIVFSGGIYYFFRQKFLNEMQKDFIQNFSHEFKTPVAVLTLAADVLKTPGIENKPEKLEQYAGIVLNQTNYLRERVEKLVDLSITDAIGIQPDKKPAHIHELIKDAVADLQPLSENKNAAIRLQLDAPNDLVNADKGYISIVLINLLENAIKYSRRPEVSITTRNSRQTLLVSIKDNGVGIEKKHSKKVFEKFFRVKTGEISAAKGLGIGLSFANQIVQAHGGKIKLESTPGVGSDFIIKLPLNK